MQVKGQTPFHVASISIFPSDSLTCRIAGQVRTLLEMDWCHEGRSLSTVDKTDKTQV